MPHTIEIGHFATILATALAGVQCLALVLAVAANKARDDMRLFRLGWRAAELSCLGVFIGFATLVYAFITSDFSLALTAQHSHPQKPLLYKIAGVWGNHEGSLMLWVVILSVFSYFMARQGRAAKTAATRHTLALALAVQATISLLFLLLILFASNPFARLTDPPATGAGLNPVLQDPGLAFHPPMLYLGYVGLSAGFAFAIAALIQKRADAAWAGLTRPWVLLAWAALTCGIALGSRWAYYELGWGGWWFWDPVENASLMPWLIATALIHSLLVVEKRNMFREWAVLLAIFGFGLSLIGTFIVRSGLLTSVHAFTNDPTRGVIILAIIVVMLGVPLILFAWRAPSLTRSTADKTTPPPQFISRETALQINNLILVVAAVSVLIGTFYPLFLDVVFQVRISVGPPFFEASLGPMLAIMLLVMGVAPLLAWRRGRLWSRHLLTMGGVAGVVCLGVVVAQLSPALKFPAHLPALAGIALAVWVMAGLAIKAKQAITARHLPRGDWGMLVAHFGVALFALGVVGTNFFASETIVRVGVGEGVVLGEARYVLHQVAPTQGTNYIATTAFIDRYKNTGQNVGQKGGENDRQDAGQNGGQNEAATPTRLISEIRRYPAAGGQSTTEAAIASHIFGDAYVVFGGGDVSNQGFILRIYHKPLVNWLWAGAGLMALGGMLAWSTSRPRKPVKQRRL